MRIIAGKYKGRKLKGPRSREFRPTSDRVKESIFNILQFSIQKASVLDLFAGSGSLGMEAISRGAAECTFVESNRVHMEVLLENLKRIMPDENISVLCQTAERAVALLKSRKRYFMLIFLDPPYFTEDLHRTLSLLGNVNSIAASESIVVAEHSSKTETLETYGNLRKTRQNFFGDTSVSFFKYIP